MRALAFLLLLLFGGAPVGSGEARARRDAERVERESCYTDRADSGGLWGCEVGRRCEVVDPCQDRSIRKYSTRAPRAAIRITSRWFERDRGPLPCGLLPHALSFLRRNGQADANGARC